MAYENTREEQEMRITMIRQRFESGFQEIAGCLGRSHKKQAERYNDQLHDCPLSDRIDLGRNCNTENEDFESDFQDLFKHYHRSHSKNIHHYQSLCVIL